MQRITQLWKSGIRGKLLIGCGGLFVLLFACLAIFIAIPSPSTTPEATTTPMPVVAQTATAVPTPIPTPTAPPPAQPTGTKVSIRYVSADGDGVYIRSKPDLEARVKVWPDGTEMTVLEQESDWCKVQAPDGYVGYVPTKYLASSKPEATVQKATPTAIATVETLKWAAIEAVYNDQSMTEAQRHDYLANLKGRQVINWQGTVYDVHEFLDIYSVQVMVVPLGGQCDYQVYWHVSQSEALSYRKGQTVTFSGTIESVLTTFCLALGLNEVTVQK
jgi:SH3-like domain-containing protein